jgi:hypothetical protein
MIHPPEAWLDLPLIVAPVPEREQHLPYRAVKPFVFNILHITRLFVIFWRDFFAKLLKIGIRAEGGYSVIRHNFRPLDDLAGAAA